MIFMFVALFRAAYCFGSYPSNSAILFCINVYVLFYVCKMDFKVCVKWFLLCCFCY